MKAKAYIVHRAMCEPVLEWSRPKNCLFFEPLYASTQAQPAQQEPVAWRTKNATPPGGYVVFQQYPQAVADLGVEIEPLYTSPQPSKQWVGLTDGNFRWMWSEAHNDTSEDMPWLVFARAIEAKLKEKNHG